MSQPPSTPVKVPNSAAGYTSATRDPDLRSQINTLLLRDGHVTKIQEALLHSLNAHSTNWPTAIQTHALALLRSGEVTNYPALLRRILEDVRSDSALGLSSSASTNGAPKPATNGDAKVNGTTTNGAGPSPDRPSLAIPEAVVEEALRVTRESLEAVCEIEDNGTS